MANKGKDPALKDLKNVIGRRVELALEKCGWTQVRLAEELGVDKSIVSRIVDGTTKRYEVAYIHRLAGLLGVSPVWLTGMSDDPRPIPPVSYSQKYLPILGVIAAGEPMYAEHQIESLVPVPEDQNLQFALRVKGDSMIDAGIRNGDLVICREQDQVDNGDIAVVIVDGEDATLKRFYLHSNGVIELRPANAAYASLIFTPKEQERTQIRIVGRAVYVVSEVR